MPIYEYACRSCEHRFEELVSSHGTLVACPAVHLGRGLEAALDVLGAHRRRRPACTASRRRAAAAAVAAAAAAAAVTELESALSPDLATEWAGCTNCALSASRSLVVAGEGPMPAELMLVADAPGFHDDRLGRPLVAAAGELLADLLASIGLERRDVYVTTLVKCRPPGTQSPAPEEIAACRDKLERQVELVRPRVVGALGDLATRTLAGGRTAVSQTHGQVRRAVVRGPRDHAATALPPGRGPAQRAPPARTRSRCRAPRRVARSYRRRAGARATGTRARRADPRR